jgi:hypothetical protein
VEDFMGNIRAALAGLAVLAALGPTRHSVGAQAAGMFDWQTDVKGAFEQARKTGKPLWVLFR